MLLDEHLDHRLKPLFDSDLEIATVHERGWGGRKNGDPLELAQPEFDVLVTMDRGIEHQQNVQQLTLGIIGLRAPSNRKPDTAPLIPHVNTALRTIRPARWNLAAAIAPSYAC